MFRQHGESEDIKKIKDMQDNKEKKKEIQLIRLKAAHTHNLEVVSAQKGEMIVGKRPIENFNSAEYGPCPYCLVWDMSGNLHRHYSICPGKHEANHISKGVLLVESSIISNRIPSVASKRLQKEVFPVMRCDDISREAKNDNIIIVLGRLLHS